jgi:type IV secretory pathway VirB10-like protein
MNDPALRHVTRLLALALVAVGLAAPAVAQWAWKDDNGRTVYSDRPPPPSVKADRIVRQPANTQQVLPSSTASAPAESAARPADTRPAPAAAPRSVAEQEMEFRKRQQERADAEKKAQEEQTKAAAKAADCERARGYLRSIEEGQRIARTDAAGNREFLDDNQRAAEAERARRSIAAACS